MGNRGVLLYVDLGKLEDEPYRLSKIYDTLGQYIDDIRRQRDIIYISKMAESLDISSLDRYRAQLVDEYDRLGTLKKILDEAYDLYKECNEKFEASGQTLCNLYAETPWYETSEGKLAIGKECLFGTRTYLHLKKLNMERMLMLENCVKILL